MPRRLQIIIRRFVAKQKRKVYREVWPIDPQSGTRPPNFPGWPEKKRFSVVLTHDVDTARGVSRCEQLMELERELGFRSPFNFVAEGYDLPVSLRQDIVKAGFEVGMHGLQHASTLFHSEAAFADQAT